MDAVLCALCSATDRMDRDDPLDADEDLCFGCNEVVCARHGDAYGAHELTDHAEIPGMTFTRRHADD